MQNIFIAFMPEIKVKLFANFREFARTKELKIQGETVSDVLLTLCSKYPGLEDMLFKDKELKPHVNVFLNGRNVRLETPLKQEDEIAIFPPVSGG